MNRPEIRELECFVAVAEHLNFSQAARSLHLSQPPLTRHIQALEEKVGARLFERNTHSVALTEPGRLFLEDARTFLQHLDRAVATVQRAKAGETSRLRLAFVGALLDEKLVRLVQGFRQQHPACQLEVTDLAPSDQLAALHAGEIDGGFIGAHPRKVTKEFSFLVWNRERLVLAMAEAHPLAGLPSLGWKDLRGLSWVMVSRRAAPAFRRQFAALVDQRQLGGSIVQESDRVPAVLTMVAAGSGVTLVPQAVEHLIGSGVVFKPIPSTAPLLEHTFAWKPGKASPGLEAFLTLLRELKRDSS